MDTFANKITSFFINQEASTEEQRDVLQYGVGIGLSFFINLFISIVIGLLLGLLIEIVIFTLSFFILRGFAGGYHAKTFWGCVVGSILMLFVFILNVKYFYIGYGWLLCLVLFIFSIFIFFRIAPDEHPNRPFSNEELIIFKKRSKIAIIILSVVSCFFYISSMELVSLCIALGAMASSSMVLMGKVIKAFNKIKERGHDVNKEILSFDS